MSITIIRAIPRFAGQSEQYYDIGKLNWKQQTDFRDELVQQHFYVQDVMLSDTMTVQIGAELRRKFDAEVPK